MQNKEFYTIKNEVSAEIIEKKSRFIATAWCVASKEDAEVKIKEIQKKYHDAKHNCFAYSLLDFSGRIIEKCSDDGEPSGTAGVPILNVIKKKNLNNILIVVTRYFGGILLGTGGLTRAYSGAAGLAIEKSELLPQEKGIEAKIELDYSENAKFLYYCEKNKIKVKETNYEQFITHKIELNEEEYKKMIQMENEKDGENILKIKSLVEICQKFIEKAI